MARDHSFSIGLPDNIVYVKQFLETLQAKLDGSVTLGNAAPGTPLREGRRVPTLSHGVSAPQPPVSLLREDVPGQNHAEGPHEEEVAPPHQRQQPRLRPLLRHQLPGKSAATATALPRDRRFLTVCLQELGKTWEEVQSEDDGELADDGRDEYEPRGCGPSPTTASDRLFPPQRLVGLASASDVGRVFVL